jgi:RNA polymerase sigma-70 factor (ECF subfamily)
MAKEVSDLEVIRDVLQGRTEQFQVLLEKYKSYLFSIVARHVPYEHVEEVAHEAAVQIYISLSKFKGDRQEEWRSWMAKIAVRTTYAFWRAHYRNREICMDSLSEDQQNWVVGVMSNASQERFEEQIQQEEASQVLNWALNKLSPEDKMVLELTALEGYSMKEVAEMLGWSIANVKVRSMRAKRKLNNILREIMEAA